MNNLPNNLEAEQSVLGSMILSEEAIADIVGVISKKDFYHKAHEYIYEYILNVYDKNGKIDVILLIDILEVSGLLQKVGGEEYIELLVSKGTQYYNAKEYANIVKVHSIRRGLILGANKIIDTSNNETDEKQLISVAEKVVFDVSQNSHSSDLVIAKEILETVIKDLKYKSEHKGEITGLQTRFVDLDTKTNGLQEGSLVLIAARPSMGKTSFAMNIAENVALDGTKKHVCIFSLEMSKEQLMQRFVSSVSLTKLENIIKGNIGGNWSNINEAAKKIIESNLHIDDTPGITVTELRSKLRRYKMKNKALDLVVIDYLQLMNGTGAENRQMEISYISRSLKEIAKEMKCPVIALSQLSREPDKRKDHRPLLSDLRESGSIEQDADIVMFIYRASQYPDEEDASPSEAELIISKQRNGSTGPVKLTWLGEYTKFANYVDNNYENR